MKRTANELFADYLNAAFPMNARPRMLRMVPNDLLKLLWADAKMFQDAAAHNNMAWSEHAVDEVDELLEEIADMGDPEPLIALSPEGNTEWYRRWSYAISALVLEDTAGTDYHILLPADAAPGIQRVAALLLILAGPARDYPREVFGRQ